MAYAVEPDAGQSTVDRRFMAAAIRLARRNLGLTATNPSVATLIVKDGVIVGRGITAPGGRPHAETQALAEAGDAARGATAYVTLEPCAHHGRTPPCATALVAAGVARVVGAASDPDPRVSGRGYDILRAAGIAVTEKLLAEQASDELAGYLIRSVSKRPEVTLKLAVSADGMIGRLGEGQVSITGPVPRRQVHLTRAQSDAILVGVSTAVADDPELTCRLPGLEARSPTRIVLDPDLRLPLSSKLVSSARETPLLLAARNDAGGRNRAALTEKGVGFLAVELQDGRIALPELLDDLAAQGVSTLMVEGGAQTARHFLDEDLVDRILLYAGPVELGSDGISSPLAPGIVPAGFRRIREDRFGDDKCFEFVRTL
jgi:diaminohydroxyphosphoribosylaminopyrimidine deaminase/5-amino-6-(5-phosphoribosylamino)uracil reductase